MGGMRPLSPRIPALLQRQPSQQELDVARHLVEHSQSTHHSVYDPQLSVEPSQNASRMMDQSYASTAPSSEYNMSVTPAPQPSPGPSTSGSVSSTRRSPTAGAAPAGQMCRYVDNRSGPNSGADIQQQLRYNENAAVEALSSRRSDLQCVWSILQSTQPDAPGRHEARCEFTARRRCSR